MAGVSNPKAANDQYMCSHSRSNMGSIGTMVSRIEWPKVNGSKSTVFLLEFIVLRWTPWLFVHGIILFPLSSVLTYAELFQIFPFPTRFKHHRALVQAVPEFLNISHRFCRERTTLQESIRNRYVGDGKCSAPGPIETWRKKGGRKRSKCLGD